MRPRYSKDVPLKGIGQLTGAVRKWSEDYLQQSGLKSLIFHKFYIYIYMFTINLLSCTYFQELRLKI